MPPAVGQAEPPTEASSLDNRAPVEPVWKYHPRLHEQASIVARDPGNRRGDRRFATLATAAPRLMSTATQEQGADCSKDASAMQSVPMRAGPRAIPATTRSIALLV